ncbi:MAG: hypothetical protein DMF85_20865 [Acidobacteria bacterium]|nr:MAG: hypothetical protein DMF85_20865 [Acidobacteriota bacterium]
MDTERPNTDRPRRCRTRNEWPGQMEHLERIAAKGYDALRAGAAVVDRNGVARLMLTGKDRLAYLQGLLTNDVAALQAGTGCYAALLTPQGRMITDMRVIELGDSTLLDVPSHVSDRVRTHLERFVFSEDVQVRDVTAAFAEIGVYGPEAAAAVASVLTGALAAETLDALSIYDARRTRAGDAEAIVIRSDEAGVRGFDLAIDAAQASSLLRALHEAGAVSADADDAEIVRIESGRPRFGVDMDDETIPLEAGIDGRAISRTKGCYVGQEVIIRVLDRGHGRVVRRLVGLRIDGASAPAHDDGLFAGDREIGRVTSAAVSPRAGAPIALGYVHRDFVGPGTRLDVVHGGARLGAQVVDLPFVKQP